MKLRDFNYCLITIASNFTSCVCSLSLIFSLESRARMNFEEQVDFDFGILDEKFKKIQIFSKKRLLLKFRPKRRKNFCKSLKNQLGNCLKL